jgi:hypothetical protein
VDLVVDNDRGGSSRLGCTYTLPPGQNADTFLAGACEFTVAEMEVFAVI